LSQDIETIVAENSQIDAKFQSVRCYLKITAKAIFECLIAKKGYFSGSFCERTICNILNRLGYFLKKVLKSKPLKKIPETDAIFENISQRHAEAEADEGILRISIDTKAVVKIGELSRNGYNREKESLKALDHDQNWDATLVPFGIHEINTDHVSVYFGTSKATANFVMDALEQWSEDRKEYIEKYHTIMIDADNGKSNASNSGFFMQRMVEFAKKIQKNVHLVYYPPYHSKYNKIERFWAVLEKHWNGFILDSVSTTLKIAANVKYKNKTIATYLINKEYQPTKAFNKKLWRPLLPFLQRHESLPTWDVVISSA
jgi:hypothetical protein